MNIVYDPDVQGRELSEEEIKRLQAPKKPDKESMRAAMRRIEAGIKPSSRTLDDFRSERLAKV